MPLKRISAQQPKDMCWGQSGKLGPENIPAAECDSGALGVSWSRYLHFTLWLFPFLCVTLGKLLDLLAPWFSHLLNEAKGNNTTYRRTGVGKVTVSLRSTWYAGEAQLNQGVAISKITLFITVAYSMDNSLVREGLLAPGLGADKGFFLEFLVSFFFNCG